ncbi:zinc finger protein (macronuclear) [Tetrahymena thermophila SB210]|uniref:Zinc finger protein n=1 Tax=Tetrahymena thermophila (strain SB210) TaxID=312017 RepID=Q22P89_TETTS|nr:zinc finger protein [Tetrahymena thermophila SB210]EAR87220.2 zinc finger protein [Tetrahymena thermophila SB210]|eukprot:XP_001007465.2 zinc finger protein [Tetrahymena thermophila SB210]
MLYYYLVFTILINKIFAQCERNEIYDSVRQQCLQCDSTCSICYNTNQNSCLECSDGFIKSYINNSSCVQNCQIGEFVNNNQQCDKCFIEGCIECDQDYCMKCSKNLEYDFFTNSCILKKSVCQSQVEFILSLNDQDQCYQNCPSSYYQNYRLKICQKTVQCQQAYNNLNSKLNQKVKQVELIQQNQYLIRANKCTFSLADQDWKIIDTQVLQDIDNYEDQYMNNGQETQEVSFILGTLGGCLAGRKLIFIDFTAQQTIFEKDGFGYDYNLVYIDKINQIIFFSQNNSTGIEWFDLQQINVQGYYAMDQYSLPSNPITMFQITLNSKTIYYMQISNTTVIIFAILGQ